jgi:hypothetical protein
MGETNEKTDPNVIIHLGVFVFNVCKISLHALIYTVSTYVSYSNYEVYLSSHNYPTATAVISKIVSSLSSHYNLLWNKKHKTGNSLPFLFLVNGTPRKCVKAVIIIFYYKFLK